MTRRKVNNWFRTSFRICWISMSTSITRTKTILRKGNKWWKRHSSLIRVGIRARYFRRGLVSTPLTWSTRTANRTM